MNGISCVETQEEPAILLIKKFKKFNELLNLVANYHNISLNMIRDAYFKLQPLNLNDEVILCLFKLLNPEIFYEISENTDKQYICWLTKTRFMLYTILGRVDTLINIDRLHTNNIQILNDETITDLSKLDDFDYEFLYKTITGHSSHYSVQSNEEYLKLFTKYNIIKTMFEIVRIFQRKNLNNLAIKWSKITTNFIDTQTSLQH